MIPQILILLLLISPSPIDGEGGLIEESDVLNEQWRKFKEEEANLIPIEDEGPLDSKGYLSIRVSIVSKSIEVTIDDVTVYSASPEVSSAFHVIALRPDDGHVTMKRQFRTGELAEGELLATALSSLQPATLLVLIPFFDSGDYLGMSERFLLSHLGFEGHGVGGAVFPGPVFGRPQSPVDVMQKLFYFERLSDEHLEEVTSRVLSSGAYINLEDPSVVICRVPEGWPPEDVHVKKKSLCHSAIGPACGWYLDDTRQEQVRFCRLYEGYGALCRCNNPIEPARLRHAAKLIDTKELIPVAILTATKPHFLYRTLVHLLTNPGAAQTPILVFTDGHHEESAHLARLFGIQVFVHTHLSGVGVKISPLNSHLRFTVFNAFNSMPNASKIIFLEDDLLLSPDFLRFFHDSAWLLDADSSIFCINAFSANSYEEVASDEGALKRSDSYPQYGWMVTRQWATEVIPLWVDVTAENSDWDWWLYGPARRKNRHAVSPEVSRTKHSGSRGAHVDGWQQAMIYSLMKQNLNPNARLRNVHLLLEENYDDHIKKEIQSGVKLGSNFNPCDLSSIPEDTPLGPLVARIIVEDYDTRNKAFLTVARCLEAFPLDVRDSYKQVMMFRLTSAGGRMLFVVGCPLSPFCSLISGHGYLGQVDSAVDQIIAHDDLRRRKEAMKRLQKITVFNETNFLQT